MLQAVANVNDKIADELVGMDALDQIGVDQRMIELDGTPNKKNLGANAILGVSLATAHAAAALLRPAAVSATWAASNARLLPAPMMNIVNGGQHADNSVDVQEFMVMPLGFERFSDALRCGCEIFHHLKKVLHDKKLSTAVGDEGGFAPDLPNNAAAIDVILEAIDKAGYKPGKQVWIAMDPAATEFYDAKTRKLHDRRQGARLGRHGRPARRAGSTSIRSARSKTAAPKTIGTAGSCSPSGSASKVQLVGDDLFVTNTERLQRGIDEGIANSILIKVNQIGTLTETIEAIELATRNGYTSVTSHRSGETEDATIADLAVALSTGQIKTGSRLAQRPHGQVQPAAADRRATRRRRPIRRAAVPEEVGIHHGRRGQGCMQSSIDFEFVFHASVVNPYASRRSRPSPIRPGSGCCCFR